MRLICGARHDPRAKALEGMMRLCLTRCDNRKLGRIMLGYYRAAISAAESGEPGNKETQAMIDKED